MKTGVRLSKENLSGAWNHFTAGAAFLLGLCGFFGTGSVGLHAQTSDAGDATEQEMPVFITIGQSNADGWGCPWDYDYDELGAYNDQRFSDKMGPAIKAFYDSNPVNLKMFFNALKGQAMTADATVPENNNTWMNLNYQSDLASGKVTMTSRQGLGTGTDAAKYARSMEAPLGYWWSNGVLNGASAKTVPLYMVKAAAGGSAIASWTGNGQNWTYFKDNVYKPAIEKLIAEGKKTAFGRNLVDAGRK